MKTKTGRLYVISILIIFITGIVITYITVTGSINSQRTFLQQRAAGLANAVPKSTIKRLAATELDADSKDYKEIKSTLQNIASINPDIRFIYITKERGEEIYFVADSEPEGSEDESPPGQLYEEVDLEYQDIHSNNQSIVIGPTSDRWGTWITGASPIVENGRTLAVLGMDIPANNYYKNIVVSAFSVIIPVGLIGGFLLLLAGRAKQREKEFENNKRLMSMVVTNVQSPLEGVKWATEKLSNSPLLSQDQELSGIAHELSRSVAKVSESVSDILSASHSSGAKAKIALNDRVDVVALFIDLIDNFKLNASTKNISLKMGSTWPLSFVIDTNSAEFTRVMTALIDYELLRTPANNSLFFTFISDKSSWSLILFNNNLSPHNKDDLALNSARISQLGGVLSIDQDTKGLMVKFTKTGTEYNR